MEAQVDVVSVWNQVANQVKEKIIHPTLWRTLEVAVPVTIDGDQFVVGFPPGTFHMSGNLTTSEHKNAIETAFAQFTGRRLKLRIIEGDTAQDWVDVKAKEAHADALREAAFRKREDVAAVTKSWEGLLELVGRTYAGMPLRQLPQSRAKYIEEMLVAISETMDLLMPADAPADELAQRSLARIIDKVGGLAETPPALIALELQRLRRR